MNGTNGVSVSKVAQIMDLYNFLPDMDLKKHRIKISDVNRPALQLSGFFEHFEQSRVQIIGNVEYTYLQRLDVEKKEKILQKLPHMISHALSSAGIYSRMKIFYRLLRKMMFRFWERGEAHRNLWQN